MSDLVDSQISKLHLDEQFLGILLKLGKVTDQIANFRKTQAGDSFLYYILDGKVGVMGLDNQNEQKPLSQINSGEFFEVDEESSQKRKLKVF